MLLPPRTRTLAAWLTLVAMTLALLAPGISRALAFAQGQVAPWGEICSTAAEPRSSPGPKAPAPGATHLLEACALCALGSDHLAPPPPGTAAAFVSTGAQPAPARFFNAPRTLFAWQPAQARAPPLPA